MLEAHAGGAFAVRILGQPWFSIHIGDFSSAALTVAHASKGNAIPDKRNAPGPIRVPGTKVFSVRRE